MGIAFGEEGRILAQTVRDVLGRAGGRGMARATLDAPAEGLPPFWADAAALGWLGLHLPEEYGGQGYGTPELAVVVEEMGRVVAPGPFLPTVVVAGAVAEAGSPELRDELLPALADGSRPAAFGGGDLRLDGGRLTGRTGPVPGGALADVFALAAGDDLVVVDRSAPGLSVEDLPSLDLARRVVEVRCDGVEVPAYRVVPGGRALADRLLAALAAAEAAGGAMACVEDATEYAKVRHQFGRPIGSFQAVKHRCADMLVDAEQAVAVAWDAAEAPAAEAELAAAFAAAVALPAFLRCARSNVQVHGGIGFTWEHDAHLFLRRATALDAWLGATTRRREQVAGLVEAGATRSVTITLPPEEAERHRDEVRRFKERYLAAPEEERPALMAAEGYVMPHWPRPWGRDAGSVEQLVIEEELKGFPKPVVAMSSWCLPTVIAYGTDAQRDRWVRPTLEGRVNWCQLFSEPEAGSDLASLRTRATKVEGGWLLNGQKVWTSGASKTGVGLCLARTDPDAPKHEGISCFVVDMSIAGVEVRPLRELTGEAVFGEVFFDDAFVPDDALVGEVNKGWQAARTTLGNERVSIGGGFRGLLVGARNLLELAAERRPDDAGVRRAIGALLAEDHVMRVLGVRAAARAVAGAEPGPEGSARKLLATEHDQRVVELAMELLGEDGAVAGGPHRAWVHGYLFSRALSIAGGTSEILRNVVGERLLGLPREPGAE